MKQLASLSSSCNIKLSVISSFQIKFVFLWCKQRNLLAPNDWMVRHEAYETKYAQSRWELALREWHTVEPEKEKRCLQLRIF